MWAWQRRRRYCPLLLMAAGCWFAGCGTPPVRGDDVCALFAERGGWRDAAVRAALRWATPVSVIMAIMRHESGFRAEVRPPRRRYLGLIPGPRPSSAYGYAQALDGTWDDYRRATGRAGALRDDFADAADFIGWYNDQSWRRNGIDKRDAYRLYLAYHSGQSGYARAAPSPALDAAARRVAATAARYRGQLPGCLQA